MIEKFIDELSLLERHILMLEIIKDNEPIGIIRLSEMLDLPKHKVRYSLRLLEKEGLISPSTEGARVTDKYEEYIKTTSEKLDTVVEMVERLKKKLPET